MMKNSFLRVPEFKAANALFTEFVQLVANDDSIRRVQFGNAFFIRMNDKVSFIAYSLQPRLDYKTDDYVTKNFIERYPRCANLSYTMLALLHEIGHHMTKTQRNKDENYENLVATGIVNNIEDYVNLHNEKLATDWAGNFASKNLLFCMDWDKKLNSAVLKSHLQFITRMYYEKKYKEKCAEALTK